MRAWVDGVLMSGGGDVGRDGLSAELSAPTPGTRHEKGLGDSVFTTALVHQGRVFAWARHVRRLVGSAHALGLPAVDVDLLTRAAQEVWRDGPSWERARLRLLWGRANGGAAHLTVRVSELGKPEGSARVVTPTVRRTAAAALGNHKSSAYAENMLAAGEARRAGASEAILATTDGALCEGTGANVFYVVDGELRTPPLSTGCLPGIARQIVVERCGVREVSEEISVAHGADEVFLTSSTREIQPVSDWSGRQYAVPGEVTLAVQQAWSDVRHDPTEWLDLAPD
ncbi:aminotransferase class IV [Nocardioides yefusunii]|uniref:Aminotransferase class IV n=1 Tax=Nocardioides yefusunii TaxID=2500546 RepID=A0ABW1QS49_9ACTN|nr:aminotransferase class IV [Nocardioides yefusunii]